MSSRAHATVDHDEIRQWVEAHNGHPTKGVEKEGHDLRIDFDYDDVESSDVQAISWEDFFENFDRRNMAFLYREEKSTGEDSTFFKFVDRDSVDETGHYFGELSDDLPQEDAVTDARKKATHTAEPFSEITGQLNQVAIAHLKAIIGKQTELFALYNHALDEITDEEISDLLDDYCAEQEYQLFGLENLVEGCGDQMEG